MYLESGLVVELSTQVRSILLWVIAVAVRPEGAAGTVVWALAAGGAASVGNNMLMPMTRDRTQRQNSRCLDTLGECMNYLLLW